MLVRVWLAIGLATGGCFQLHDPPVSLADGGADGGTDAEDHPDASDCLLRDPGFMDPAAWSVVGGATVEPTAVGYRDPGEGRVTALDGSLTQSTCVPAPAPPPAGGGVALTLGLASTSTATETGRARVVVGSLSQSRGAQAFGNAYVEWTVCIGEAAQGIDTDLTLAATSLAGASVAFDSLVLAPVPPDVCPAPATVRNGDFETAGGWGASDYVTADPSGNHVLDLRPNPANCCNCASAVGLVSVPPLATLPVPALSMRLKGTLLLGGRFTINTNPDGENPQTIYAVDVLPTDFTTTLVCLPAADHAGRVSTLIFDVSKIPSTVCPEPLEAVIDDVRVVDGTGICTP